MTAGAIALRRRAGRPGTVAIAAAGIASVAVAVLAGIWAGRLLAPHEPAPAASRVVRAGAARLVVPGEWRPTSLSGSGAAGLDPRSAVALAPSRGDPWRVIATVAPADDPSLIAPGLRALLAAPPPPPRTAHLAGWLAWRYPRLATRVDDRTIDVTVLPTTGGVLSVACVSPAAVRVASCASAVESVSVAGAAALVPSVSVALAHRLPAVLVRLDQARVERRAALRRARTPAAQAAAARGLSQEHLAAAESVRAAAGDAGAPLVTRLVAVGHAYGALARAADDGSVARFGAARREVDAAEAGLAGAVDGIRRRGPRQVVSAASAPRVESRPTTGSSAPSPAFPLIMLAIGGALVTLLALWPSRPAGRRSVREPDARARPAPKSKVKARPQAPAAARPARKPKPRARPETAWRCEIAWKAGLRHACFRAEALAPGEEPRVVAESAGLDWPPLIPPPPSAEFVEAAVAVRQTLADAGWTPAGEGRAWYARQFVWSHAEAPAALETGEPMPGWTCEITWRAGLRAAMFRARAARPGEKPRVIAQSAPLEWAPLIPPPPEPQFVGAAQALHHALIDAGWTPIDLGPAWYARRFAWPHAEAPAILDVPAARRIEDEEGWVTIG